MAGSLEKCRVDVSKQLVDAMRALEEGAVEIALVTDEAGRLVGTLTDGDIRRALLAGATLDSRLEPYLQRNYTSVSVGTGRAEVLDLMRARTIGQIPVLGPDGELVGLHLLREFIGGAPRPNWAVVMAGGRGSRLQELTRQVPKPMLRVAGRPILERVILHLAGFGIRRIFLSVNYLGGRIEEHFGDGQRFGCSIDYLREAQPLGTGGAITLLPETPTQPIVVMNGDLVTQADIGGMLDFHERGGCRVTIGIHPYFHTVPFGCVEMSGDRIVLFEEKPRVVRNVNAGIYILSPSVLQGVPRGQGFAITSLVEDCLKRGETVCGYPILDDWIDVGRPEELEHAREGTE